MLKLEKEKFVVGADAWLIRNKARGMFEMPVEGTITRVGDGYALGTFNRGTVDARIDMFSAGEVLSPAVGTGKIVFLARIAGDDSGNYASVVFEEDFPAFQEAAKRQILWNHLKGMASRSSLGAPVSLTTENLVAACRALGIVGEDDVKG